MRFTTSSPYMTLLALLGVTLASQVHASEGFQFQSKEEILLQIGGSTVSLKDLLVQPQGQSNGNTPPPDYSQFSGVPNDYQGQISGLEDKLKKTKQPTDKSTPTGVEKRTTRPTTGAGAVQEVFGQIVYGTAQTESQSGMHIFKVERIIKIFSKIKIYVGYPSAISVKAPARARELFDKICKDADAGGLKDGSSLKPYKMLGKIVTGFENKQYLIFTDILPASLYDKRYNGKGDVVGSVPGDEKTDKDLQNDADRQKKENEQEYNKKKEEELAQRKADKAKADKEYNDASVALNSAKASAKTAKDKLDDATKARDNNKDDKLKDALQKQVDDAKKASDEANKKQSDAQADFDKKKAAKEKADKADQLGKDYQTAKANYEKLQKAADDAKAATNNASPEEAEAKQNAAKKAQDAADAARKKMDDLANQVKSTDN